MVFTSPLLRGVLTAIFWVRKPAYPTGVMGTVEDGVAWSQSMLRAAV